MKTIIYLTVLIVFSAGYFHERWERGILSAEVKRLQLKVAEWEARDILRSDEMPQRWGNKYLREDVRR